MLQTLGQVVSAVPNTKHRSKFMSGIPDFLDAEIEAGGANSSRSKAKRAARKLFDERGVDPRLVPLDLATFDELFPRGEWNPIDYGLGEATYEDYRSRVRAVIERMLGIAQEKRALRATRDDYSECYEFLRNLEEFKTYTGSRKLISFNSTFTMAGRRNKVALHDVDQPQLLSWYDEAITEERRSLRTLSCLVARLQVEVPEVLRWIPNRIEPIKADGSFQYNVPAQFRQEIEHFVELASRKRYIRAKKVFDYVADGTRKNFRVTMHGSIDALIATENLNPRANCIGDVFERKEALEQLVDHFCKRIEAGEISKRTATSLIRRLPVILDRNGIDSSYLRDLLKEVDELQQTAEKCGIPMAAVRLCRSLIENRSVNNRFLLSHLPLRKAAQDILDRAKGESRPLTPKEQADAIHHGVVAAFCAFEVGGAPVRVENFLEASFGTTDAWVKRKGSGFRVNIPGEFVKNHERIRFKMKPNDKRWCDTIDWYLKEIRPLILRDPENPEEVRASKWFVPMLSDIERACPYETFLGWFKKLMRDVVKIPCLPHHFRHGQASLMYRKFPHRIGWICRRLGDKQSTVVKHYAFVHREMEMAEAQQTISDMVD